MELKFIVILVVVILITAGICISFYSDPKKKESIFFVQASATSQCGKTPLNVTFHCDVVNTKSDVSKFEWDFGDGNVSKEQNTSHIYHWAGRFLVTVKVWNSSGDFVTDTCEIHVLDFQNPIGSISADNTCGSSPLKIQFTAEGYDPDGGTISFQWDFGDGSTSTKQNPTHVFEDVGSYHVWLHMIDDEDQLSTDSLWVTVIDQYPPQLSITADHETGKAPLEVQFSSNVRDIDSDKLSYEWVFEDAVIKKNSKSNGANPSHTFWFSGTYKVKCRVTDEDGNADEEFIQITVDDSAFSKIYCGLRDYASKVIKKRLCKEVVDVVIDRIMERIFK